MNLLANIEIHKVGQTSEELIDSAVQLIEDTGLKFRVDPFGTTIEGSSDQVWILLRAIHELGLKKGANCVHTTIKLSQGGLGDSIESRLENFKQYQ